MHWIYANCKQFQVVEIVAFFIDNSISFDDIKKDEIIYESENVSEKE